VTRSGAFRSGAAALIALLLATAPAFAAKSSGSRGYSKARDAAFQSLGERYIQHELATRPQLATRLGIHDHDDRLIPVTGVSLAEDAQWTRQLQGEIQKIPRAALSPERQLEYDLLRARLAGDLLEIETLKPFEHDPSAYLELVAGSIQSLLQRDFASPCRRLHAVSRRLRQVPEVLRAARINLRQPSRLATEVAIEQYAGVLRLDREGIGALSARCKDPALQGDVAEADSVALRAVEDFIRYLRRDLLPRSEDRYAIGAEAWHELLAARELDAPPADSLLARGHRALVDTRARMTQVAERITPGAGMRAALDTLAASHPPADSLVAFVKSRLGDVRSFLVERRLLTLPSREDLTVRATPPFQRSLSFASLDPPGVWEKNSTAAYYNVTPVERSWPDARAQQHLGFFNRWSTDIVTIHEALPGHDVQTRAARRLSSRLRQFLVSGANVEGWAHYCEQMMLEEGFGKGDPRYELAQLDAALLRIGRLVASISIHTRGMTLAEAQKFFEEECLMPEANAVREARRAALDPMVLVYTLGKWRILELRDEVRAARGSRFQLREFHDAFLRQGPSALPVARIGVLRELAPDALR
jgi:uncharacterized protein (DUF885 family)